ncbi:MAG: low molecular weight protein-tyrosine-phosphatase, partial [Bacteroidota bacterium]|nr:low molecular weight protein-tyrosine-phosphatase [Bacteroidota bacterium]
MERNKEKIKLLFVCLGNICRSPAGEEIMRQTTKRYNREKDFVIDSCGIGGWHIGQLPDKRMRLAGKQRGYNFSHLARQFYLKDFEDFDYIFCMDKENISALYSKTTEKKYLDKII